MVAMAKVFLLLLVVLKATALENSRETNSNHKLFLHSSPPSPSPLSYPPFPSPPLAPCATQELDTVPSPPEDRRHEVARALCIAQCGISCLKKKSFLKDVCLAICAAKCAVSLADSLDDIACTVDCTQPSTHSLRYDASKMEDRVSTCNQQCKRD